MNKYFIQYLSALFLLSLLSCGVSEINETAPIKVSASPKPGGCIACHESKEVLPQDHVDTKGMMGDECGACHKPESISLRTKIPLSHMHQMENITCKECHGDSSPENITESEVCLQCHGQEQLLNATIDLELNPHFYPHEDMDPKCNLCHHQHKSSENFCIQCHELGLMVP